DLEEALQRFEDAWRGGEPPRLDQFLPKAPADARASGGAARQELLAELIKIDLEYRWQRGPAAERPRLENYLGQFPELGPVDRLAPDLIGEEYRVRQRWGDRPGHADY